MKPRGNTVQEHPALPYPGGFTAHLAAEFRENSPWRDGRTVDWLLNKAITMRSHGIARYSPVAFINE